MFEDSTESSVQYEQIQFNSLQSLLCDQFFFFFQNLG